MAMATGEEIAQKIHDEQLFRLFETGLKASSKNLKFVKFRVDTRHTLLILRTINFWNKQSSVFKCWEPFYEADLLSLKAAIWIWSSPTSNKELLQGKIAIVRLLLVASLDDHALLYDHQGCEMISSISITVKVRMQQSMREEGQSSCYHASVATALGWADTAILCGGSTLNYSLALAWTSAFLLARAIKSLARYQDMSRYWHVAIWQLDDRILTRTKIRRGQSNARSECHKLFGVWSFLVDGWWFCLLQCPTK